MRNIPVYKWNTGIFYVTYFFRSLSFTIPIWIVYYHGKISASEISYLVTLQYLAQMLLELPSGALADLIGRRITDLIGWIVGALSFFFFPFATEFWHFLVLALMVGLFDSFRSGSEEALLYDTYKQAKREKKYDAVNGNASFIFQVGLIIATATGGFFYEKWMFLPYILYGVSLLLGTASIWFYKEPFIDSEKFTFHNYVLQIRQGSQEAFKNKQTTTLSLFYIAVAGISWSAALYFTDFMMISLVPSNVIRGIFFSLMRLLNIFLIRFVLQNNRIVSESARIVFFPIIMIIAFLPGFALKGYWGIPFIQAAMITSTARWILLSPLINTVFSSKYRATAISFLSLLIGFVYIFTTTISAPIITAFGIKTMYSLLGIISCVSVVPLSFWVLYTRKNLQ